MANTAELTAAFESFLASKTEVSDLTDSEKRQVIDALFPNGVAFYYTDPKITIGDSVYGRGNSNINSGGFFFGTSNVNGPLSLQAHLTPDIEM